MCDMLVTKFPTQRKDEQTALVNFEVNRKLVLTNESETNVEAYVQDIIRRRGGGKRIHVNVSFTHIDNVSLHSEISVQKWKYIFQRRIAAEREK